MSQLTSTSQVDPAVGVVYDRVLLMAPQPKYIYTKYAEKRSVGTKQGTTIKFRRYSRLSAATTALSDGITPTGSQLAKVDLTATVSQYGDFVTLTDVVKLTVEDDLVAKTMELQNDQVNNTNDQLCRDYICASASSTTCSNGTGTATLLNQTDIDGVAQTLRGNNCDFMFQRVNASAGVGTAPVRASYVAMADTDLEDDLRDVANWLEVVEYSASQGVEEAEVGNTGAVRWLTSTEGYTSSSNYYCPIMGRDTANLPYAMIDLGGGNVRGLIKEAGSAGSADPLDQRSTIGWKQWQAYRILQDLYIHTLICTNG